MIPEITITLNYQSLLMLGFCFIVFFLLGYLISQQSSLKQRNTEYKEYLGSLEEDKEAFANVEQARQAELRNAFKRSAEQIRSQTPTQ
jgi:Na+-transporting methylmalonyl-CoA/oxaloacetate decarboxylase gamma subunit